MPRTHTASGRARSTTSRWRRRAASCGPIASQLSTTRLISERLPQNGIKISKYSIRWQANIISISNNSHSILTKMCTWKIRMTCRIKPAASICITRKMPRSAILQQGAARPIARRLITATIIHRGRGWPMRLLQPSSPTTRTNVCLSTVVSKRKSFYPNNM